VSYRRDDAGAYAGRIADWLIDEFGSGCVFMDVDGIPLGVDFVKHLTREVESCDVLLAMIGAKWISIEDETGKRRLEDPADFVRIEIGAALRRDIPVIPILVDGAKIPRPELLPEDIKKLSLRNGLEVRLASFRTDMDRLIGEFAKSSSRKSRQDNRWIIFVIRMGVVVGRWAVGSIGGALAALAFLLLWVNFLRLFIPILSPSDNSVLLIGPAFILSILGFIAAVRKTRPSPLTRAVLTGLLGGALALEFSLAFAEDGFVPNPWWLCVFIPPLMLAPFGFFKRADPNP
jgi:hypothetical protein